MNAASQRPSVFVGDVELVPLNDGEFITGPEYFGPNISFAGHEALLADDGKMHLPIGCFLCRGGPLGDKTILLDAGLGEMSGETFVGGHLIDELAAIGVRPADVDIVICSHLHLDHCGWLVDHAGKAVFTNATISVGQDDWTRFVVDAADVMVDSVREGLKALFDAGRVRLLSGDVTIEPALSALGAPGHTPGHLIVVVSDHGERAVLLGDAISCPVQLQESDWGAISDVDPALARATRERMWSELETSGDLAVGAHFPGLSFGRVITGASGRRWL